MYTHVCVDAIVYIYIYTYVYIYIYIHIYVYIYIYDCVCDDAHWSWFSIYVAKYCSLYSHDDPHNACDES
jgi:hypothetical protein